VGAAGECQLGGAGDGGGLSGSIATALPWSSIDDIAGFKPLSHQNDLSSERPETLRNR
jgi:hypothetical protein